MSSPILPSLPPEILSYSSSIPYMGGCEPVEEYPDRVFVGGFAENAWIVYFCDNTFFRSMKMTCLGFLSNGYKFVNRKYFVKRANVDLVFLPYQMKRMQ